MAAVKSYFSCFTSNPKKVPTNVEQKTDHSPPKSTPRDSLTTSSSSSTSSASSTSSHSMDPGEEFIFAARPLHDPSRPPEDQHVDPHFVILFVCAAEGVHHVKRFYHRDPQLSEKGLRQARVVRKQLRRAQQAQPNLMLCSSLYRCLSTAKLVCGDWYGTVPLVALDELRPPVGTHPTNQRSSIASLAQDFTHATFKFTKGVLDQFWSDEVETEEMFCDRLQEFVYQRLYNLSERRLVIVSHRCVLNALFQRVVESSTELQVCWKHCDLRKVFVYKRKDILNCTNFVSTRPAELGTLHSISSETYMRENSRSEEHHSIEPHPAQRTSASFGSRPGGLIDTIPEVSKEGEDSNSETPVTQQSRSRFGIFRKGSRGH